MFVALSAKYNNRPLVTILLVKIIFESVIKDVVLADDDVTIPGVCKVKSKVVPERTGKIMMGDRKGEIYTTPAHKEGSVKIVPQILLYECQCSPYHIQDTAIP